MEKQLNVKLLYHTPDPQRAVATAARLCYSKLGAADLMEKMSDEQAERVLGIILAGGHSSTLEHASYTFAVEGVSRALTHQLVRHRMASYNQQSQRYVEVKDGLDVIKPADVSNNDAANQAFDNAVKVCEDAYEKMIAAGIKKEDARFILPNATETKIVVTMNIRELLHFFSVRCCNRAQ